MKSKAWLSAVVVAIGALAGGEARALDEFSAQNFRPPIDPWGYVTVEGAKTLAPDQKFAALYYDWARRPLIFDDGTTRIEKVRDVHWLDLAGGYGITSIGKTGGLEAGLDLPIAAQDVWIDGAGDSHDSAGLGDLRTDLKLSLGDRDDDFFACAFRAYASWPTGRHGMRFMSNDAFTLGGEVAVEGKIDFVRAGLNLGWEWIDSKFDGFGARVDDRFHAGFALAIAPLRDISGFETLELVFEATHWTLSDRPWDHEIHSPVEVGGALRYNGRFFGLLGASAGVNRGVGAPDARVDVALGYSF